MVPSGASPSIATSSAAPRHVAIIMDGNGRWAKARGLPRAVGHERGVEALRRTVQAAGDLGVQYLTVFSFSTENWRRPVEEVSALFGLLKIYVQQDLARLRHDGVRIRVLGVREGLPQDVAALVDKAEQETAHNDTFFLNIAFNYGGRDEILRAARRMAAQCVAGGRSPETLTNSDLEAALDTHDMPDPDLLIRTSDEHRLSNFLLWQSAYTEFVFMDVLWPDFSEVHLRAAIETFQSRERRFGGAAPGAAHG
jgi:undecaprenyl diphosphate synthase